MQDVEFENTIKFGMPAGASNNVAVALDTLREDEAVYAEPQLEVWQWPGGPTTLTQPLEDADSFLLDEVLRAFDAGKIASRVCHHVHAKLFRHATHVFVLHVSQILAARAQVHIHDLEH